MAAPVARDQELELSIDSLAYGGNGVARLNGFVVFVRRGLPGDRVRARVTKVKRNHAEALAVEVLQPGPQRVDAPCAHYPACGGCRFQDLAYETQIAQKQAWVRDAFQRIGPGPRLAQGGTLGRGARHPEVLADDGHRQRRTRGGPRLGARGRARGL